MAGKAGLSNKLLDMYVAPVFCAEHLLDPNQCGPVACIVAAWTEEGSVKVQVVDSKGRTKELFLGNVRMWPNRADAQMYYNELKRLTDEREKLLDASSKTAVGTREREMVMDDLRKVEDVLRRL